MPVFSDMRKIIPYFIRHPVKQALRKVGRFLVNLTDGTLMNPAPEREMLHSEPERHPLYINYEGRIKLSPELSGRLHQTPIIFGMEAGCLLRYYRGGIHLDIGCGSRKITASAIGVDICSGDQPYLAMSVNINASANDLRVFSDQSIDFISAMHSFEHYDNPEEVLTEWHRVLHVGGRIGIIVPHRDGLIPEKEVFAGEHKFDYDHDALTSLATKFDNRFKILALDTLQNGWSIDLVLEKVA